MQTRLNRTCMFHRLFVGLFLFMIVFSSHAQATDQGDRKITLTAAQITLKKVFNAIRSQTGLMIMYNQQATRIDIQQKVDVNFKNTPVDEVLEDLFGSRDLEWTFNDNVVVIRKKKGIPEEKKIVSAGDSSIVFPVISGKVVDPAGNPLVGVSIKIDGTSNGTVTDATGSFAVSRVSSEDKLIFSYVGYQTRILPVNGKSLLVSLPLDVNNLDEAVVIAYGNTTKRFNTGNITVVRSEEIARQPVNNPLLALQGNVPGLFINQSTGVSGGSVSVSIQGQNTLLSGSDPFYVIDGVPYQSTQMRTLGILGNGSPFSFINPSDIESITVLKDADATAIYGSRAANGAILITTKKGKAGVTKVDVNLQQGFGKVVRKIDMLNTQEYLEMRHEALRNDGRTVQQSDKDINGIWDTTRYTNWQKTLIGNTSSYTNLSANVSGGTTNIQYLIGATYHRESTVFPGDFNDQKSTVHFSISNNSPNRRFRSQLTGSYMIDLNRLPLQEVTGAAFTLAPDAPAMYNSDGSINWQPNALGASTFATNPAARLANRFKNNTGNLVSNLVLSYELIPGLTLRSNFGYTNTTTDEITTSPLSALTPEAKAYTPRSAQYRTSRASSWIIEPQLTYNKEISNGKLDALIGTTIQQSKNNGFWLFGTGYNSDLVLEDISSASTVFVGLSSQSVYKYNALFGKINYNYLDKYLVNLTARRDGSSRFGPENRFSNFGAVGLGWLFSSEGFFKNHLSFISFGKLRASYGTTGNDQIGDYSYLDLYDPISAAVPYQGTNGLTVRSIYNPYLQWEQTNKLNIGLDLGVINDRILLNVNYFRNRSSNLLTNTYLPSTAGIQVLLENFNATIQNTGLETSVSSKNIITKNFTWSTTLNITIPRNKLVRYDNLETSTNQYVYFIGKPVDTRKVFHYTGIDPDEGVYTAADAAGKPTKTPNSLTDANVFISTFPSFYGGITNSISYKGFQLDIMFQFVSKKTTNNNFGNSPGQSGVNQIKRVMNRWQKPGDNALVQRFSVGNYNRYLGNALRSDAAFENGSYARLKNLSLSYQVPSRWLGKSQNNTARVYMQAQNILTITKYTGIDPETAFIGALPPLQIWTFGVQFGL